VRSALVVLVRARESRREDTERPAAAARRRTLGKRMGMEVRDLVDGDVHASGSPVTHPVTGIDDHYDVAGAADAAADADSERERQPARLLQRGRALRLW